jgi:hypothetical protein
VFYLAAAVAVAIVCTVLNLVLTFGVIRKLREHDALIAGTASEHGHAEATAPPGATVAAIAATTVDGRPVSSRPADGPLLVGFFSPDCRPCEERIPEFIRYHDRTGVAAIAVVIGDELTGGPHVSRLSGHVDVVVEPRNGPFGTAFQVTSYPALCLVDPSGLVLGGGNAFSDLPDLVPA